MTKTELARDLAISQPYVTKLVAQGLVAVRRDGTVNRTETLRRLHLYWCPALTWWEKPVGPVGTELRRRWRAEEQRAEKNCTLIV